CLTSDLRGTAFEGFIALWLAVFVGTDDFDQVVFGNGVTCFAAENFFETRLGAALIVQANEIGLRIFDAPPLSPGAGRPRSSLAPSLVCLPRSSPSPPSSSRASSKHAMPPAPASSLTRSRFWPIQKRSSKPSTDSGISKPSRAPMPLTPPRALSSLSTFPKLL